VAIDLFFESSRPALGFTQPHIQRVLMALVLEVERPGLEAVGVKNDPLYGSWLV
jgi:hypothetical protein